MRIPECIIELGAEAVQFCRYGVRAETFEGIEDKGERKSYTEHEQRKFLITLPKIRRKISRSSALQCAGR
jgi:hypothetical protein